MRRIASMLLLICWGFSSAAISATAQNSIIDAFERGKADRRAEESHKADMEERRAGAEYYKQQLRLLELQNKGLEQQLKQQEQQAETVKQISSQIGALMQVFSLKHADWKAFEPSITCLSSKIQSKKINAMDYMDMLYLMAKSEVWSKDCPSPVPQPDVPFLPSISNEQPKSTQGGL